MQLDITAEALLKLLKIDVTKASLTQMQSVIDNTQGAAHFFKHLFSLNDALSHLDAFIGLSSSVNNLKIKYHGDMSSEMLEKFNETVSHWGTKYKVALEKVSDKETYYIRGLQA